MFVAVRPINVRGKPLNKAEREKEPAHRGKLSISENRLHSLGRAVLTAKLTSATDGLNTEVLPELFDAMVLWLDDGKMRIRGFEDIGGVQYAQTWTIEVQRA